MREYVTEAVVLAKEPVGEADARVVLYTHEAGRVEARITSSRKITSKLSPHLEPLMLATVRIVEKRFPVIADALQIGRLSDEQLPLVRLLLDMVTGSQRDQRLWELIVSGNGSVRHALVVLGFDPGAAACSFCGNENAVNFLLGETIYACMRCTPSTLSQQAYLSIGLA